MEIHIGLGKENRKTIAEGLSKLLADTYTLYLKTHNFHWNVTGPMFATLHAMFEGQYMDLANAVDELAERIRALGFPAPASYKRYAELTTIPEETGVPSATDMIKQLVLGQEEIIKTARSMYPNVEKVADEATADLITHRIKVHEKTAWMLRSLLEN